MRKLFSLGLFVLAPGVFAQGYYEVQLRSGQAALASGNPVDAVDNLRIAAFGLLDRPALLCEALETLALAQDKAGQAAATDATFARLVEIARAFPACRDARLEPSLRSEFAALARKKLSAAAADQLLARPAVPTSVPTAAAPPPTAPPTPIPQATPLPIATPTRPPAATVSPVPAAPPPAAPPSEPVSVTPSEDLDRQPQLKSTTRPIYPAAAQRSGIGGIVLLRVLVSERGEPFRVEVTRGVQADIDEAAIAAVRQWRFEPGQKGGKAVAAWMTVAVPFDSARQ